MADNSLETALNRLYCEVLPSIQNQPMDRLPKGLYRYILAVSARQQFRLCLLTVAVFPLSMIPLELQRRIVDTAIADREMGLLLALAGIYLAVLLVHSGLKYARNLYMGRTAEGVIRILRKRVYRHGGDDLDLDEGARVSMMSSETEKLGGFVAESISQPLLHAGILLTIGTYMVVVEPLVALVALAFFIPSVIIAPLLQARVNEIAEERTERVRELGNNMVERDISEEAADETIETVYGLRIRIYMLKNFQKFISNLMGHLGPLAVLTAGGWMVIEGRAEVGTIVAFISGLERMTDPARQLLNFYRQLSQTRVQYRLVHDAVPALS